MTSDVKRIIESKRKLRRDLAARPIGDKFAMLDVLRERAVTIGRARHAPAVQESAADYGAAEAVTRKPPGR